MENLRAKMKAHPFIASMILILVYLTGSRLIGLIFRMMPNTVTFDFIAEFIDMGWTFALVYLCGYTWVYKQRGLFKSLFMVLPHVLIFGLFLFSAIMQQFYTPQAPWQPIANIIYGIVMLFAVGFNEESIFRGIIVNLLGEKGMNTRRDVMKVVFLSGLLFGLAHLSNATNGVSLISASFQSISAIAGGILFTTYYLRGGSLWAVMLVHSLQDSVGLFESLFVLGDGGTSALNEIGAGALVIATVFILVSLFMLRKSKCEQIIARYARLANKA